ncbi:hypothetical protein ACFV80_18590 [Streptomyces sp. NPDC059862]|uniref:hypothetical protein n=1 Tax=Streptomyces sp. NPDC059862 TaxID=3346975 RepID=UPI00365B398C
MGRVTEHPDKQGETNSRIGPSTGGRPVTCGGLRRLEREAADAAPYRLTGASNGLLGDRDSPFQTGAFLGARPGEGLPQVRDGDVGVAREEDGVRRGPVSSEHAAVLALNPPRRPPG